MHAVCRVHCEKKTQKTPAHKKNPWNSQGGLKRKLYFSKQEQSNNHEHRQIIAYFLDRRCVGKWDQKNKNPEEHRNTCG